MTMFDYPFGKQMRSNDFRMEYDAGSFGVHTDACSMSDNTNVDKKKASAVLFSKSIVVLILCALLISSACPLSAKAEDAPPISSPNPVAEATFPLDESGSKADGTLVLISPNPIVDVKSPVKADTAASELEIQKHLSGMKIGKYRYFIRTEAGSEPALVRTKDGKKLSVIATNVSYFTIDGSYIYYNAWFNSRKIYRVGLDGKGKILLTNKGGRIICVRDGVVYYANRNIVGRVDAEGEVKRLAKTKYYSSYAFYGDRLYYSVASLVDHLTGTERSYVKSVKLDGSDRRKETKMRKGWCQVMAVDGSVMALYGPVGYIKQADGSWSKVSMDIKTGEDISYYKPFFMVGDKLCIWDCIYNDEDDLVDRVLYSVANDGHKEKLFQMSESAVSFTEDEDLYVESYGSYLVIEAAYDQSMDGIYVFDLEGNLIAKQSLFHLSEDGYAVFNIEDDVLYVRTIDTYNRGGYYSCSLR